MTIVFAYIDPGVGTLIWQSIAAVALGSLYYVRRFFGKLRGRGKGKTNS
jgi:hypothetical protein